MKIVSNNKNAAYGHYYKNTTQKAKGINDINKKKIIIINYFKIYIL
jgi:hypothetical protein